MRKRLTCILLLVIVMTAGTALAATYTDASQRISFYYQYDGAEADSPGRWDKLLASKLYSLSGHDCIYNNSSTSKYLTGRGCCLFSFSHAWQYLLGKASNQTEMATILYNYLKQKPVWSNTNSTLSPPNAAGLYASYLGKYVTSYSVSNLKSYSALASFFTGSKGCLIVNAPGHYIIAVGVTTYDGVQYVQIVDSVLSGTIRTGRGSVAKSMDFSKTYTPSNAAQYAPSVHQYWLPYSYFNEKCVIRYAYKVSSVPGAPSPAVKKSTLMIPAGGSDNITVTNITDETITYKSSNTSVCTVTSGGSVKALKAGTAQITCIAAGNANRSCVVTVKVFDPPAETGVMVVERGKKLQYTTGLPSGLTSQVVPSTVTAYGVSEGEVQIKDSYGDIVYTISETIVCPDPDTTLVVPDSIVSIEEEALAGVTSEYILLHDSVAYVGERAFAGTGASAIIVMNPDCELNPAVGEDCSAAIYQVK